MEPVMILALPAPPAPPPPVAADLQASGRLLARLAQSIAAALVTVQRERIRPRESRPLHRV